MSQEINDRLSEKNRVWILICISLSIFLPALDQYIVPISLPQIGHHFSIALKELSKVILYYFLALTGFLMFFGRMGDLLGLKRTLIWGHILFLAGSIICVLSEGLKMLLVGRVLQGIGSAGLYAMINPVISNHLPSDTHGRVFGLISIVSAIGIAVGAPIGGWMTTYLDWRWVFFINIPICFCAIFFIRRFFEKNLSRNSVQNEIRFDVLGLLLSVGSLAFFVYALNQTGEEGWSSFDVIGAIGASFFLMVFFWFWQKKCDRPLLDLDLFKIKGFLRANVASVLSFLLMAGSGFLLPFYLIQYKGMTADKAGLLILIYSFIYMMISPVSGRFSDKVRSDILCSIGMLLASLAGILFAFLLGRDGFWPVLMYLALSAFGYGMFIPPNNRLIMDLVPVEKRGIASGLFKMMSFLGLLLGISLFTTIFSFFTHQVLPHEGLGVKMIINGKSVQGFKSAYFAGAIACFTASLLFMGGVFGSKLKDRN